MRFFKFVISDICFTVLIQPFIAETTYFFSSTASIFLDQSLDSLW